MGYLKQFGVNRPSVISVISPAGQGKSSMLAALVKDIIETYSCGLIITDESEKLWFRRLNNILPNRDDNSKLVIKNLKYGTPVYDFVKKSIK